MTIRQIGVGIAEPTIEIRNAANNKAWVEYTFTGVGGQGGECHPLAIREDLLMTLPAIYSDVYVIDYTDEEFPALAVIVILPGLDTDQPEEELYDELWPITQVINNLEVEAYIVYD